MKEVNVKQLIVEYFNRKTINIFIIICALLISLNISSTIIEVPYKHILISDSNSHYEINADTMKLILPKLFIPLQNGNYFLKYANSIDQGKNINGKCFIEDGQFVIKIVGYDRRYNEFPEFDLYYINKLIKLVNHDDLVLITNLKMNELENNIIFDGVPISLSDSVFYLLEKGNHEIIIKDNSSYSRTYSIDFDSKLNELIIFSRGNILTSTNTIGLSVITSGGTALLQSAFMGPVCCVFSQSSVNPITVNLISLLFEIYFGFGQYGKSVKEFLSHNENIVLENNGIVPNIILSKTHFIKWGLY